MCDEEITIHHLSIRLGRSVLYGLRRSTTEHPKRSPRRRWATWNDRGQRYHDAQHCSQHARLYIPELAELTGNGKLDWQAAESWRIYPVATIARAVESSLNAWKFCLIGQKFHADGVGDYAAHRSRQSYRLSENPA